MRQVMITTVDNPYDPFTEFDEWNRWDVNNDYHTSAYLARVVRDSDELAEGDEMLQIEIGIDEIIKYDPLEVYIKLTRDVPIDNQPSKLINDVA